MSCQTAASRGWDHVSHRSQNSYFFNGQSYDVSRDVVCVSCHHKQVILVKLLQDRRKNMLMA